MQATTTPTDATTQQRQRLRNCVKQLVIELGYLEHCLAHDLQDVTLRTAATGIDTAIDCLNDYLS